MRLYNCKVRLNNDLLHEVYKKNLSAPEILILREVHGQTAVVDIVPQRSDRRPHAEHRAYLERKYDAALRTRSKDRGGATSVEQLFGKFAELPKELPEHADLVKAKPDEGEALVA